MQHSKSMFGRPMVCGFAFVFNRQPVAAVWISRTPSLHCTLNMFRSPKSVDRQPRSKQLQQYSVFRLKLFYSFHSLI